MNHHTRVDAALEQALEREVAFRSEFLAALRATDPDVAAEVEELLRAHELSDGVLDAPALASAVPVIDRRIGPYRVMRELGRGGMGVVYLAERDDGQFRRRVAVKLLRSSPDASEVQQRFLAERQILALLDHPNIAQLIDGGVTDGRLPYLVMEYVEGMPITQYCDRHRLGIADRLRVFQDVCAAVHHAHRNLVIHRDLKPGNILVTQNGQVKLLDFGIAKLLNPGFAPAASPVTWTSHRVLTPEYASPEQLRGEPLSTTSDVYALGVVLYELLAGRRPHEANGGEYQELVTRICEQEPLRPSVACAQNKEAAAARDLTPAQLSQELRGDIDAIVLMALRKEPGRRYGSADLLAQDVQRYLEGLPVQAHKGSRSYYVQKFARRHRITVTAAALVLVSLVTGAGVALRQTHTARNERDVAQQSLRQAEEITAFLVDMFQASDPDQPRAQEITARDLLRRGVRRAEELRGQPIVQARMLAVMGQLHHTIGDYAEARPLLERALAIREAQYGKVNLEVAQTLAQLAETDRYLSHYADAYKAAQRALDIRMQLLGRMHPDVARSMMQVAVMGVYRGDVVRAEALCRRAVAIREAAFGVNDTTVASALLQLSAVVFRSGKYEEAETYARRAIDIDRIAGPETPQLAGALLGLAYLLEVQPGRAAEAESLFRQGMEMRRRTLGPENPLTNFALGDLVYFLAEHRRFAEALPLAREHYDEAVRIYGRDNPRTADIMTSYARVLRKAGRRDEALPIIRSAVDICARTVGVQTSVYAGATVELALLLDEMGRSREAEALIQEAIRIREAISGPATGLVALYSTHLANIQLKAGRAREAEQFVLRAMSIFNKQGIRPVHPDYQYLLRTAAQVYDSLGNKAEAERYRRMVRAD